MDPKTVRGMSSIGHFGNGRPIFISVENQSSTLFPQESVRILSIAALAVVRLCWSCLRLFTQLNEKTPCSSETD
jgi:hypothetical protein